MNGQTTVAEFIEVEYTARKSIARPLSRSTLWRYARCAAKFSSYLGRDAVLDDFSDQALAGLKQSMLAEHSKEYTADFTNMLGAVWSLAYQLGAIESKASVGTYRGLKFIRPIDAGEGSGQDLSAFVAASGLSQKQHQNAVQWFSEGIGRPATIGDLQQGVIDGFLALIKHRSTTRHIRVYIRMIWREAHRQGLTDPPPERKGAWEGLATIIHQAPPIVIDTLPEESKNLSLSDFLEDHYYVYQPGMSSKTKHAYGNSVNKFESYLNRRAVVADLNNQVVGSYLAALFEIEQSDATVEKERGHLLAFWRFAYSMGLLVVGPVVQPIVVGETIPTALDLAQLKQLRRSIPLIEGEYHGIPKADLMRACFGIQYTTAARIGEALALEFADISNGVITFRAETRKFGKEPIVKSIPDWVQADIDRIRKPTRKKLFPVENAELKFCHLYNRLFKLAGVQRPNRKSSHLLRSTHATMIWVAGGDASKSLGHANEETTRKSYLDPRFKPDLSHEFLPDLGRENEN